eukprot:865205-Alexandrium_andersonii.AAC.1
MPQPAWPRRALAAECQAEWPRCCREETGGTAPLQDIAVEGTHPGQQRCGAPSLRCLQGGGGM